MNPLTILALIRGDCRPTRCLSRLTRAAGNALAGQHFAEIAMSPKGALLPVLAGIAVGALVSFAAVPRPCVTRAPGGDVAPLRADGPAKPALAAHCLEPSYSCASWYGFFRHGASILKRKLAALTWTSTWTTRR